MAATLTRLESVGLLFMGMCKSMSFRPIENASIINIEDLLDRINAELAAITDRTLQNVQNNLHKRMQMCLRKNGGHFEKFLR